MMIKGPPFLYVNAKSFVPLFLLLLVHGKADGISEDSNPYKKVQSNSGSNTINDNTKAFIEGSEFIQENEVLKPKPFSFGAHDVQSNEEKNHILKKQYNATVIAHALTNEENPQIRGSLSRQENTVHDLDNDGNNEADSEVLSTYLNNVVGANLAAQLDESLECYTCASLNGNTNEPCWRLNNMTKSPNLFNENESDKVNITKCNSTEKFCKVHRVEYLHSDTTEDGEDIKYKEWSMERGCTTNCDSEQSNYCVEMGARTKVLYCTSCCKGSLCNSDNKAPSNGPFNVLLTIHLVIFTACNKLQSVND